MIGWARTDEDRGGPSKAWCLDRGSPQGGVESARGPTSVRTAGCGRMLVVTASTGRREHPRVSWGWPWTQLRVVRGTRLPSGQRDWTAPLKRRVSAYGTGTSSGTGALDDTMYASRHWRHRQRCLRGVGSGLEPEDMPRSREEFRWRGGRKEFETEFPVRGPTIGPHVRERQRDADPSSPLRMLGTNWDIPIASVSRKPGQIEGRPRARRATRANHGHHGPRPHADDGGWA